MMTFPQQRSRLTLGEALEQLQGAAVALISVTARYERSDYDGPPHASLDHTIGEAKRITAQLVAELIDLRSHRCDYNDNDVCVVCGRDGRA